MQYPLPLTGYMLKQLGIKRAEIAAGESWNEKAIEVLERYLKTIAEGESFQCEDFRSWSEGKLPQPENKRAYGAVMQKAARLEMISWVGIKQVKNNKAHCANASVWKVK